MSYTLLPSTSYLYNPLFVQKPIKMQSFLRLSTTPIHCFHHQNPIIPNTTHFIRQKTHIIDPLIIVSNPSIIKKSSNSKNINKHEKEGEDLTNSRLGMLTLCGFGYWVQGFRCFPWLALNFHMANNLNFSPSIIQLVQYSGTLPMVAKPLYGVLSDALYIGGAHRLPYISIGVILQVISWGSLALIPVAGKFLPILMACVLLSNLGASITEVAKDALVAEYGQKNRIDGLQSYAFMALAFGGILGNFLGGYFLLKTQQPKSMFLIFASLLCLQLAMSLTTSEKSLGLPKVSNQEGRSFFQGIKKQYSDLMLAIGEERISRPLFWIVASISVVPILSCSMFCYQTQYLNLDPSVIGMSRVVGQLMLLSVTLIYGRFLKNIPLPKLIWSVQILYACSLLLDLVLVKQVNLKLGIPNDVYTLCFSGMAEAIAQFKLLPFQVMFASLAPPGCEGSLMSFLAAAFCLSSITSGFLGVGLASVLGISSGDYSNLPVGIAIQFLAALLPLQWIQSMSTSESFAVDKGKKKGLSKRRRRNRRVGRVFIRAMHAYRQKWSIYAYRQKWESEAQR